jgi:hypothetical protein
LACHSKWNIFSHAVLARHHNASHSWFHRTLIVVHPNMASSRESMSYGSAVRLRRDFEEFEEESNSSKGSVSSGDERPTPDLEILGLHKSNNGRSCKEHPICGSFLEEGDLVCLEHTEVSVDGRTEAAVKVVKLEPEADKESEQEPLSENQPPSKKLKLLEKAHDEPEPESTPKPNCTVGYISKALLNHPKVKSGIGRPAIVVEIYDDSENQTRRLRSIRSCGMASIAFLEKAK